jgi:hypothetical protein
VAALKLIFPEYRDSTQIGVTRVGALSVQRRQRLHKEKGLFLPGPCSEAYPPLPDGEATRYGGYGGASASRFSASFLIKFETYELG